ncbi:MAG: hypothetical protein AAF682_27150 [Planctomycetota bacterium]
MDGSWSTWRAPLEALCDDIRAATLNATREARAAGTAERLARPAAVGAGDVTFGLDEPSEHCIDRWLAARAAEGPLSVLTEDRGWRHQGPAAGGGVRELDTFAHGGPRIAFDPIDGTRNLMAELRSAWTVVSFAPPGDGAPRQRDVSAGIVAELPTRLAAIYRVFHAERGGPCAYAERSLATGEAQLENELTADDDDRPDHGYLPFFRYRPEHRPALARLEAAFFERLERHEDADLRSVYDDQYISNAGQLALLSLGTYRAVFDARALVAQRLGEPTVTSKPYDVAGAIVCAQAAGAVVLGADGGELDFPIDTETPVHFSGYANEATRRRLEPHWMAVLERPIER